MSNAVQVLLAERDELRDRITRLDRAIELLVDTSDENQQEAGGKSHVASATKLPSKPKKARKQSPPSEALQQRVTEYVNSVDGTVEAKTVGDALDVSKASAGRTLAWLAKAGTIQLVADRVPGRKGKVMVYGRLAQQTDQPVDHTTSDGSSGEQESVPTPGADQPQSTYVPA